MGKRKERRLAAMKAASRRVKLDLCAEPSGDVSDLSAHAEGGDSESKCLAKLPSSSGFLEIPARIVSSLVRQKPENPLLLLEQYSDEEVDKESSKELHNVVMEKSLVDIDEQVMDLEQENKEITANEILASQHERNECSDLLDSLQKPEFNGTREIDSAEPTILCTEIDSSEKVSSPAASDPQDAGDTSLGWKMVLHEESNQYYYWNTLTGETSWEVPAVLAQETEVVKGQGANGSFEAREMHKLSSALGVEYDSAVTTYPSSVSEGANSNHVPKEICQLSSQAEFMNEECKGYCRNVSEKEGSANQVDVVNGLHHSSPSDETPSILSSGVILDGQCSLGGACEKWMHDTNDNRECFTANEIFSQLLKHGECLLEKLKSLEGSVGHVKKDDWISKLILEVEIRLSDIKLLSVHGSSLFPFWKHSARQLKKVEAVINDKIGLVYEPEESVGDIVKMDTDKTSLSLVPGDSQAADYAGLLTDMQKDSELGSCINNAAKENNASVSEYPVAQSSHDAVGQFDIDVHAVPDELTPNTHHIGEDIDMDVDMEVEEPIPIGNAATLDNLNIQPSTSTVQPIFLNLSQKIKSIEQEEGLGVAPPPTEEWIPPPPPDDEPFPPPPPDEPPEEPPKEPPEPSYSPLPSDLAAAQPFSYLQPYTLSYTASNINYYMQANTEVPGNIFYASGEVPQPQLFYEAVPAAYTAVAPSVIDTAEPAAYFGLHGGMVPCLPEVNGVESSALVNGPSHVTIGSDLGVTKEHYAEVASISFSDTNVDGYGVNKPESSTTEIPLFPVSVQDSTTVAVAASVSTTGSLTLTTAAAATTTAPKVQSKVPRTKKRTVAVASTLRSNKKVSSLVDKWKAAKEELQEEEDTPQNAYELLEKKRQREIEEWHAQQISSGESKENANFQPLGGDWRERLKRKRSLQAKEAGKPPLEVANSDGQQPDLNKISWDLPSGWQAYWDESSKQVYYGNAATSETTWIRPSK